MIENGQILPDGKVAGPDTIVSIPNLEIATFWPGKSQLKIEYKYAEKGNWKRLYSLKIVKRVEDGSTSTLDDSGNYWGISEQDIFNMWGPGRYEVSLQLKATDGDSAHQRGFVTFILDEDGNKIDTPKKTQMTGTRVELPIVPQKSNEDGNEIFNLKIANRDIESNLAIAKKDLEQKEVELEKLKLELELLKKDISLWNDKKIFFNERLTIYEKDNETLRTELKGRDEMHRGQIASIEANNKSTIEDIMANSKKQIRDLETKVKETTADTRDKYRDELDRIKEDYHKELDRLRDEKHALQLSVVNTGGENKAGMTPELVSLLTNLITSQRDGDKETWNRTLEMMKLKSEFDMEKFKLENQIPNVTPTRKSMLDQIGDIAKLIDNPSVQQLISSFGGNTPQPVPQTVPQHQRVTRIISATKTKPVPSVVQPIQPAQPVQPVTKSVPVTHYKGIRELPNIGIKKGG